MEIVKIPKVEVLNLIKKDTCKFYDYGGYRDLTVDVVLDSYTRFEQDNNYLYLSYSDLAELLFVGILTTNNITFIVI